MIFSCSISNIFLRIMLLKKPINLFYDYDFICAHKFLSFNEITNININKYLIIEGL